MVDFKEFEEAFNEMPQHRQDFLWFSVKFQAIAWIVILVGFIISIFI